MYCGTPTKKGNRGEHILQEALGGAKTLNDSDICNRAVCTSCNTGCLSQIDKELCSRSYLSIIASQKIDAHLWQTWDIDHAANNLLVEGRPLWPPDQTLGSIVCYPQVTFEADGRREVRGDLLEVLRFGQEHFPKVLFKAVRECFGRFSAGRKGALHLERIRSSVIYEGCRFAPRVFTRHSIGEIAQNIHDQSFILRYVSDEDKRLALHGLSKLAEGRQSNGWSQTLGSHTPTICCFFDAGDALRALMKIGLNLIAAYCPNTPIDRGSFGKVIRVIRGHVPVSHRMIQANGFVHAEDIRGISGAAHEHSFRLIHVDHVWHVYSSFFGGSIGAYVRLPGPSYENWNCADIVAPIKSKSWTFTPSRILPIMRTHIEWRNTEQVTPTLKVQNSQCFLRTEIERRK
jgi:hypothetical protein